MRWPSPPLPPVTSATAPWRSIVFSLYEGFGHRRIDQRAQIAAQGEARLAADDLRHKHDRHLFLRIDAERRRGGAAPGICAERAGQACLCYIDVDATAEREADPGIIRLAEHAGKREVDDFLVVRQVVEAEQRDRFGAEDLRAVECAAVQHHAAEAQIILGRRDEPAAARFQLWRRGIGALPRIVLQFEAAPARFRLIAGGEALDLVRRYPERGVIHAERLEQARAQELAKAHAGQFLDEIAE